MAYNHDIFISYRRLGDTRTWIENYFVPLLENHLSQELGRNPIIFTDSQIETGDSWPNVLGQTISTSKVIILLWSKKYLESLWCSCEIGHMLEREKKNGYRTIERPDGLIFPTVIHDGETMPIQISTIQKVEMQEFFKLTLNKDGQKYTEFEDKVKTLAGKIAKAIDDAPQWQNDWQIEAVNSFVKQFHKEESTQNQPPRFSN
ncbi:TIR domain-containing protein [Flavobacterium sp. 9]|jgi:TIR domain|uniref:TIR domain-containing protein n=1 Tax=Flavobacterium sp. 9 TaxID=2035198 RepID=UPI000C173D55|nr:TIR domain-containing protein [Flavobacterium sp. 9]PIF34362.1 TIR domain-containing protein [Flavobacterium sp. 9]